MRWRKYTKAATGARATRNANGAMNVVPKFGRLEIRKHFFTVRTTTAWNSVPGEVKEVNSATSFKTEERTMCDFFILLLEGAGNKTGTSPAG